MEWLNFYSGQGRMEKTQSFGQPVAQAGGGRRREAPRPTDCRSEKACRRPGRFQGARRRTETPFRRNLPHTSPRPAPRDWASGVGAGSVRPRLWSWREQGWGAHVTRRSTSSTGLLQPDDVWSATAARPGTHGIQDRHQLNIFFPRFGSRPLERPGAPSRGHWETSLPRPRAPRGAAPRGCSPPITARLTKRCACAGARAAAEHPGNCSLCAGAAGPGNPASRRNLDKSEHSRHPGPDSHLHTCPVTPHSLAGLRSGRAPRENARSPLPISGLCWRRRGPLPAPRRHPPRLPPPSPVRVGPVPEERRRPPQRPQEGRRWAPQAMPLPRCSGGGRCDRRRRRRRGSRRGAAAAAAAAEGPRAGGGGREGHRRRR